MVTQSATAANVTSLDIGMNQVNEITDPQIKQDIEYAQETLRLEANALMKQAEILGADFSKAIDLIMNLKGRVVVTGMGKSGHVGKKMAATFASTGTPSFFVHPAEASHGDMGMIGEQDAVIALSKGGESPELRDIINYCKRFDIPLLAICAKPQSSLGRQADVLLSLADCLEACPNQQAPTTSTTLTIALGDALAVTLMKRRGFSATDFRQYHPGGKLGGQLVSVSSLMQKEGSLPLVTENTRIADALVTMSDYNFGCAIVTNDNGLLAGFLTDGDIRRHLSADLADKAVKDVMGKNPRLIESDALAAAALASMNQHNITQLVVVKENKPVGLIRLHDILRAGVA